MIWGTRSSALHGAHGVDSRGGYKDDLTQSQRLPDAFAWQIVDAEQAARVGDTTGWVIRELTDDRWLISTPELDEGTLGEVALAQLASPTPDDVENARTSLADLLVHTSIYV